jgi:D-alanyl-D-alanine carboxypeptidase/D-alanyl-D-alanine-endopeptidase (penicillin-binding protein 4)
MRHILTEMMHESVNLYAETLVRAMGEANGGEYAFEDGKRVVQDAMAALGLQPASYRYADGSGLSRYNYLSPRHITSVLAGMVNQPEIRSLWLDLFPAAGTQGQGTLANRLSGTPLEGNLRAKTGSMSSVRALSGYFTARSRTDYAFAILVNGHMAPRREIDGTIDRVLLLLYEEL